VADQTIVFCQKLIDELPVGILLLNREGKIVGFNKKQEKNSRIARSFALGKTVPEVYPNLLDQGLREHYLNLIHNHIPFSVYLDKYVPQYYDATVSLYLRGSVFSQGTASYALIVQFLEESNPFVIQLLDANPDIVIAVDSKKCIVVFNKAAQHIFGYKNKEIAGHSYKKLFHPNERDILEKKLDSAKSLLQDETRCLRKDGSSFPAEITVSWITDDKNFKIANLFIIQDITEKKVTADNLQQAQKLAVLGKFAKELAHQLNNPLVGVVNLSELLHSQFNGDEKQKALVQSIYQASKDCKKVVQQMLLLPDKIQSNSDEENQWPVNITLLLEEIMHYLKGMIGSKKIIVKKDLSGKGAFIKTDPLVLKQAFVNIIVNAIEAMSYEGTLTIKSRNYREKLIVEIIDTGEGISKHNLTNIFEPFFTTKGFNNSGLGLSLAQRIIYEHKGIINISSLPDKGTSVKVKLPVERSL